MSEDRFIPTPEEIELGEELDREFPKMTDAIKWAAHLIRNKGWTKIEPEPEPEPEVTYGYEAKESKDFMGGTYYELDLYENGKWVDWWAFRHRAELDIQIAVLEREYGPFDEASEVEG